MTVVVSPATYYELAKVLPLEEFAKFAKREGSPSSYERRDALKLAEKLVQRDAGSDSTLLARQLLRAEEACRKLHEELASRCEADNVRDLVESNRDTDLRMAHQAFCRVRACLERGDVALALRVLAALNLFHPMHGESWPGWPEGS